MDDLDTLTEALLMGFSCGPSIVFLVIISLVGTCIRRCRVDQEATRILVGKALPLYMRVYILSNGEVFPEMEAEFKQLWSECVNEAANTLGYL